MCGIAGLVGLNCIVERNLVLGMCDALKHRGPDDEGYLAVEKGSPVPKVIPFSGLRSKVKLAPLSQATRADWYLGHVRLSILDLSWAGHQPMNRANLWITYNGEIYNYIELRMELEALGHEFNSRTDTEVILAAYQQWGEDCVKRFNGDWAFCILDLERRVLFLSRDRYGIKPLYYFQTDDHFAFASEIKALLTLPFIKPSLSQEKAIQYILLFCLDHTKDTFYMNISQLRPGHNMVVDLHTGHKKTYAYYSILYCRDLEKYNENKAADYVATIRELLIDAVRLRLRADVPIGTCLSGGLDSSAIVAIVKHLLGTNSHSTFQKTFTASFPNHPIDESRYARAVLEHTGAEGHFIYPMKDTCFAELPSLLHHQDEPFGGSAIYAQWAVMREASHHVKVVLDGQGGDEVFGGYRDYRLAYLADLLCQKRLIELLAEIWSGAKLSGGVRRSLQELTLVPFFLVTNPLRWAVYRRKYGVQLNLVRSQLGFRGENDGSPHLERRYSRNTNELLYHYMATYSLPHLLKYEDRNSMAHSVEARVPFTDYRLVDYVFGIPATYKIHRGWTKWLLRLAVQDLLPPEIVWRKDKLGFATPPWISREDVWTAWLHRAFPTFAVS